MSAMYVSGLTPITAICVSSLARAGEQPLLGASLRVRLDPFHRPKPACGRAHVLGDVRGERELGGSQECDRAIF